MRVADQSAADQPDTYEKPKYTVRLGDDGELISDDDAQELPLKQANRRA